MIAHYGKFTSSNISSFTVCHSEMGFLLQEKHLKKTNKSVFLLFNFQLYPRGLLIYSCLNHVSEAVSEQSFPVLVEKWSECMARHRTQTFMLVKVFRKMLIFKFILMYAANNACVLCTCLQCVMTCCEAAIWCMSCRSIVFLRHIRGQLNPCRETDESTAPKLL